MIASPFKGEGRGRVESLTLARFVSLPENRSALVAVQDFTQCVASKKGIFPANPLYVHGPAGSGKTHLTWGLVNEACQQAPELSVAYLAGADFRYPSGSTSSDLVERCTEVELLIVEDLQHFNADQVEILVQIIDERLTESGPMVFSANVGPKLLDHLPGRLTSRLAGGLVVGVEAPSAPGRLLLLRNKAKRQQLALNDDVLQWLADHLPGGCRQLEGALDQLGPLARLLSGPLTVATVAAHFQEQAEANKPTVERITRRVSTYFMIDARQLQSRRRHRNVMLPRQVSMYLARQLTGLSLGEIGSYFGGRDHTTVLHACRKVERALAKDAVLSGAIRQMHGDLA